MIRVTREGPQRLRMVPQLALALSGSADPLLREACSWFWLVMSAALWHVAVSKDLAMFRNSACPKTQAAALNGGIAVMTMWIDEAHVGQARSLLPRAFRASAVDRVTAWACAARATTHLPLFILTANLASNTQSDLCNLGLNVIDATQFQPQKVFHPMFDLTNTSWKDVVARKPQSRTDGWKTAYKFMLWNLTVFDRIVYYDLDVILLGDPLAFVNRCARWPFVTSVECGTRGYIGLNSHLMLIKPNSTIFDTLIAKSATSDYAVVTNTEQDVLEAYWCPYISEIPGSRDTAGVCATAASVVGRPFKHTYDGSPALFLSSRRISMDYAPHIHDAYITMVSCRKWVSQLTIRASAHPCSCLADTPSIVRKRSHYSRRRLNEYGKCEALLQPN